MRIVVTNHLPDYDLTEVRSNPLYYVNDVWKDTELDNINQYNDVLNEYVSIYLIYKNECLQDDIIGFCHYQRLISECHIDPECRYYPQYFSLAKRHPLNDPIIKNSYFDVPLNGLIDYLNACRNVDALNDSEYSYLRDNCNLISIELNEYLKNHSRIKFSKEHLSFVNNEYWWPTRNMSVCNRDTFNRIGECVCGFIDFIIQFEGFTNIDDWANHIRAKHWRFRRLHGYCLEYMIGGLLKYFNGFYRELLVDHDF